MLPTNKHKQILLAYAPSIGSRVISIIIYRGKKMAATILRFRVCGLVLLYVWPLATEVAWTKPFHSLNVQNPKTDGFSKSLEARHSSTH